MDNRRPLTPKPATLVSRFFDIFKKEEPLKRSVVLSLKLELEPPKPVVNDPSEVLQDIEQVNAEIEIQKNKKKKENDKKEAEKILKVSAEHNQLLKNPVYAELVIALKLTNQASLTVYDVNNINNLELINKYFNSDNYDEAYAKIVEQGIRTIAQSGYINQILQFLFPRPARSLQEIKDILYIASQYPENGIPKLSFERIIKLTTEELDAAVASIESFEVLPVVGYLNFILTSRANAEYLKGIDKSAYTSKFSVLTGMLEKKFKERRAFVNSFFIKFFMQSRVNLS